MINILLPKPRTSKSCTTWFTAAPEDRGTDPLNLRLSKVAEDKYKSDLSSRRKYAPLELSISEDANPTCRYRARCCACSP